MSNEEQARKDATADAETFYVSRAEAEGRRMDDASWGTRAGWWYRDPHRHFHGPFSNRIEAVLRARAAFRAVPGLRGE